MTTLEDNEAVLGIYSAMSTPPKPPYLQGFKTGQ